MLEEKVIFKNLNTENTHKALMPEKAADYENLLVCFNKIRLCMTKIVDC